MNVKRTFVPTLLFPWVYIPEREMLWEKLLGEVGIFFFFWCVEKHVFTSVFSL